MRREIMQQALDALEYHTMQTRPINHTDKAIEALKQELAKPEQTYDHESDAMSVLADVNADLIQDAKPESVNRSWLSKGNPANAPVRNSGAPPKSEQEPVAWLHPDKKIDVVVPTSLTWFDKPLPLYTAAPRKECEIEQARREERGWCHQLVWDYSFSRVDNEDVQEACSILAKQILAGSKK